MLEHPLSSRRILFVEDDEAYGQLLALNLERKFGCNVSVAHDAFEAANLMSAHGYDLILTDWQLPEMNGFRSLERAESGLALDPAAPQDWFLQKKIPVIVVTACDSAEVEKERRLKKRFQFLGVVSKGQSAEGVIDQIEMIYGNSPRHATA